MQHYFNLRGGSYSEGVIPHGAMYRRERRNVETKAWTWVGRWMGPVGETKKTRKIAAADVPGLLSAGNRVFLSGLSSESSVFRDAISAVPGSAAEISFTGALVPGINTFDYAQLHPATRVETLFVSPFMQASAKTGKILHLPMGYYDAYRWFGSQVYDLVVVQVAPPDAQGQCSLGTTADFQLAAMRNARSILAHINPRMPRTSAPAVSISDFDYALEAESDLPENPLTPPDETARTIGRHVASLVGDGACLQLGIGKIPASVLSNLVGHRNLGLHSGLLTDEIIPLLEAGVVNGALKEIDTGFAVTNAVVGTRRLYDYASHVGLRFRDVGYTHDLATLSRITNLVSINSAVEVDLFGQINSETVAGRQISGLGGAADFAMGANLSEGGRAIIALPATTQKGKSRIVGALSAGTPISIARSVPVTVVTEFGAASLAGLSTRQRAEALLRIADPLHQADLERAMAELGV